MVKRALLAAWVGFMVCLTMILYGDAYISTEGMLIIVSILAAGAMAGGGK